MKYIHIYNNRAEYNAAEKEEYDMSLILNEDNYVVFYMDKPYSEQYFTIESLVDNNIISLKNINCSIKPKIYYSLDNGESWDNFQITQNGTVNIATINTGDKIIFKSINDRLATGYSAYNKFDASGNFKVYGNIMSLLYGAGFKNITQFNGNSTDFFSGLFYGTTNLIYAENLILPVTTLKKSCYNGMFRNCSNLINAPQLPALNLAEECYSSMFECCVSLVTPPELPATNLQKRCYARMFCMNRDNTVNAAMTKSPILHVNTLQIGSYFEMFKGNGNLTEITCLATDLNSSGTELATSNWVMNISPEGVFIKNPEMDWSTGNNGIPSGWSIQNYTE